MATNQSYADGRRLGLNVAAVTGSGTGGLVQSGDPVAVGQLTGVAQTDEDANGQASVDRSGVYALPVNGVDQVGNSAVANGDKLYYTDGDAIRLSKKNTGVPFGAAYHRTQAIGTPLIAAGADGTIDVIQGKF